VVVALTSTGSASAIADSCRSSGLGGGDSSSSVSIGGGVGDLGVVDGDCHGGVGDLGVVDGDCRGGGVPNLGVVDGLGRIDGDSSIVDEVAGYAATHD